MKISNEMKRIAVIIPVFNRIKHTKECFSLLEEEKQSLFFRKNDIKIILADDGSTDGTGDWVSENYPDVIILNGTGDLWWSGTMNLGVRYALHELMCDFILLWENDIIPIDHYFDHLQEIMNNWDGHTMICSKVYYRIQPDRIFAMGGKFNPRSGSKTLIGRKQMDGEHYKSVMEVDWSLGQGVLIHRTIFEKVGYFDERNFPQYSGDADFSLRVKEAGFKNRVYPDLKLLNDTETTGISHIKEKSLRQFIQSLISTRSSTSIIKDFRFYRAHATSFLAYGTLVRKYFIYTASFIKWSVLGWLGIRRSDEELY
jgi:GT2 family glycosyltransferase